jgi:integral membrane sensor domain MASE1
LSWFCAVSPVIFWNIILNCSFHTFPNWVSTSHTGVLIYINLAIDIVFKWKRNEIIF